jgi:hypothetical protein
MRKSKHAEEVAAVSRAIATIIVVEGGRNINGSIRATWHFLGERGDGWWGVGPRESAGIHRKLRDHPSSCSQEGTRNRTLILANFR